MASDNITRPLFFITLASNDADSRLIDPSTQAAFIQRFRTPITLEDDPTQYEIALVSLSISGVNVALTGSLLVDSDCIRAESQLGGQQWAFLQSVPAEPDAAGTIQYENAASLVIFRRAAQKVMNEIRIGIQTELNGAVLTATGPVVITLAIRHVSRA